MTNVLLTLGDVFLLTSVPALLLFVSRYFFRSRWRALHVGRSLMYFALSLLLLVVVVSLGLWLGPNYPGREYIRVCAYGVVSFTTWRLYFTLRLVQKRTKYVDDPSLTLLGSKREK